MSPTQRVLLLALTLGRMLTGRPSDTALHVGDIRGSAPPRAEAPPAQQSPTPLPPPNLRFERISTEDGLPHSNVRCMLQDAQGYMWFCTNEGVAKYDGYSFKVYKHDSQDPNSLRANRIELIYQDRSSVMWVATEGGWLERFDRDMDQFAHYEMPSTVRAMHEDTEGTFWIGVDDPGLLRFDRAAGEVSTAWRVGAVRSIFEDREGVIWVGTQDGWLARHDREQEQFVPYEAGHWVEAIAQDPAGQLWIGTIGGGLARFDRETAKFAFYRHIPDDPHSLGSDLVSDIHVDGSGALWIGAYRSGLNRLDPGTERFARYQNDPGDPHSLSGNLILCVYQDRSGVLWVGTELGGISTLGTTGMHVSQFRHHPNDPNTLGNNAVTSILQDPYGLLWVATRGGLSRLNRASGQWRHYQHDPSDSTSLNNDYVSSLYQDRAGVLWVGTGGMLDRYDPETDQFVHYPVIGIYGLIQDHEETFWVTAADGLYQYDRDQDHFVLVEGTPLRESSFWSMWIHEDSAGYLWMGTAEEGLGRYDPRTSQWRFYQHDPDNPQSLSHNNVEVIWQDQSGVLWVGTHRGLDRFDPETETFTHYGTNEGLPSDTVLGILQDTAGNLWLSTNQGLSRFDPHTETLRTYDVGDGLQGNQFSRGAFYRSASGEMFFGGNNGLNAFYPEQITDNLYLPPVVITAFSVFSQIVHTDLSPDEHIELTHRDNFVSFDFAALDYNNPDKNQYAYWMEGLDEDWVQAGARRHADYPNLPPGDYVFHVKGSNSDGVWNEEGGSVRITIQPPFWGTLWFRILVGLVLVGVTVGAYRLRVRGVEARSRELERQVAQRTTELSRTNVLLQQEIEERHRAEEALAQERAEAAVLEERNRLARELHDSVTQALYGVTLYAEAAKRMLGAGQLDNAEQHVRDLGNTAQEALAEMRLLIFELRPLELQEQGLVSVLQTRLEAVEGRAGLQTEFNAQGVGRLPSQIEEGLYGIVREALNNVLNHARATRVSVAIRQSTRLVSVQVRDDGVGFNPESAREAGGMGLRGITERAELLGGSVTIESEPGKGTLLCVEVPT